MSYFIQNLRRFAGELLEDPIGGPARVAAALKVKWKTGLEQVLGSSGMGRRLAARYRGRGVVLMFHEIHDDVEGNLRMGCSPEQLRMVLAALRAESRDIVTPDEAVKRLADPQAGDFAVLTFDDGYRDNRTMALPILEEFSAPMTMFVPTGMVTREVYAWWLGLRALFQRGDEVEIEAMERRFTLADAPSRNAALRQIGLWIGTDRARAEALNPTFARHAISIPALVDKVAMDEREIRSFADHPLVTIGGHTTTHTFLSGLDDAAAYRDINDNKLYLENLLDRPVRHFAYPYGTEGACGKREAEYVKAAGFETGFTTRSGHLFPAHLSTPCLMPREDAGFAHMSNSQLANRLSGARRALVTKFGDPVAGLR